MKSLDHDRALRRIAALIGAIKRTNYFQQDADGSIQIAPEDNTAQLLCRD